MRNGGRSSVVCMALSFTYGSPGVDSAVLELIAHRIIVVASVGNRPGGVDASNFSPARVPEVIAVGASTFHDAKWLHSNYGRVLNVWAPGTQRLLEVLKTISPVS